MVLRGIDLKTIPRGIMMFTLQVAEEESQKEIEKD